MCFVFIMSIFHILCLIETFILKLYQILKICQTLLMTIYNINFKKIVQQLMFMIKFLNGFVIKWTDKINHLGHIINHGDDDCLNKQGGFNGLVDRLTSLIAIYGFIQSDMCMLFRS